MNDLQGQREEVLTDKNVSPCDLPEVVVCNCKELTHNAVKDICVDEGVLMVQEKFLFNKEETVRVNENVSESKLLEDNKFEEVVDTKDVVTGDEAYHEVGCEKSQPEDVLAKSGSVSNKALLTLRDIILMEDSHTPLKPEGNMGREIEQKKTGEKKSVSWRYLPSEMDEPENQRLNNVLNDDSYDHLSFASNFPNEFVARSFSEAESGLAHITYPGPISVSGNLSARSDGSTVSTNSFAFPILQKEWNSSPARMAKAEKRQEKGWKHYSLICCRF